MALAVSNIITANPFYYYRYTILLLGFMYVVRGEKGIEASCFSIYQPRYERRDVLLGVEV